MSIYFFLANYLFKSFFCPFKFRNLLKVRAKEDLQTKKMIAKNRCLYSSSTFTLHNINKNKKKLCNFALFYSGLFRSLITDLRCISR